MELIPLLWSLGSAAAEPSNTGRPALCKYDAAGQGRVRVKTYLNKLPNVNARRTSLRIQEKPEKKPLGGATGLESYPTELANPALGRGSLIWEQKRRFNRLIYGIWFDSAGTGS
jgi:hypothetical protein